jgi:hypothetical protein
VTCSGREPTVEQSRLTNGNPPPYVHCTFGLYHPLRTLQSLESFDSVRLTEDAPCCMRKTSPNCSGRSTRTTCAITSISFRQEDSFHSKADGTPDPDNLRVDTGTTDRVLIADWYCYYGGQGPEIPAELNFVVHARQGHRSNFTEAQVQQVVAWVQRLGRTGPLGEPKEWQYSRLSRRGI